MDLLLLSVLTALSVCSTAAYERVASVYKSGLVRIAIQINYVAR